MMEDNINYIVNELGSETTAFVKRFSIGKNHTIPAAIIFINNLIDKNIVDRDILTPLMFKVDDEKLPAENIEGFLLQNYITVYKSFTETDINKAIETVKSGSSLILSDKFNGFIIADTAGGVYRSIEEPMNEATIAGSHEGFVENIEVNMSILKRHIKDKNLVFKELTIGRRTQTKLVLVYINDIADKELIKRVEDKIKSIDVDDMDCSGILKQYLEDNPLSPFPQVMLTERPDTFKADIFEGRIGILLNGSPAAFVIPTLFFDFFQSREDYSQRTWLAIFLRILRIIATFIVITVPSIYLSLIEYNVELIPIKFLRPIVQFREGIALTPFLEILSLELVTEFLREGGLRLPPKIASTLSIVGGITIGDMAIRSKMASPTTLLIIGLCVISSFLIPNYEIAQSIVLLKFPMIVAANALGFLGITGMWFVILIHLFSMKNFDVPYFTIYKSDLKDTFIRYPLWQMEKRPESIPNNNKTKQGKFYFKWRRKNG